MERHRKRSPYFGLLIGMLFSFSLSTWMCQYVDISTLRCLSRFSFRNMVPVKPLRLEKLIHETNCKEFLFIAVMTSEKYMGTRARSVWDTWGKNVPGKLVFFTGYINKTDWGDIPIIQLDVEDNIYPPQKKSLTMLRYVCDHYLELYKWFIRADDDVYMRIDRLVTYLKQFDSSEDMVIGQPGIGKKDELGILGLGKNDNFCLGGPGIIMTSGVLRKMGPHLLHCINSTASLHEDVEVGRCIRRFGGVICPWAYEMKELFRQVYENPHLAYHGSLDTMEIDKSINLHPIKDPAYMRRMHTHFLKSKIVELNERKLILQRTLRNIEHITNKRQEAAMDHFNYERNVSLPWEFFDFSKVWALNDKPPLRYIHDSTEVAMNAIVGFAKEGLTRQGEGIPYHSIDIIKWHTGYMRVRPTQATDYFLDLPIKYQTRQQGRTITTRTRRSVQLRQKFGKFVIGKTKTMVDYKKTIHFIVPLMGRLENFKRFLASFEEEFLVPKDPVKLLVIYFPDAKPLTGQKKAFNNYVKKYPSVEMKWLDVKGSFKRAVALQLGTNYYQPDSLLYYCDVDLVFRREFAERCRANAKIGERAYFPVMFSQFNPKVTYVMNKPPPTHFHYIRETGFWRWYSFGPVCAFAKDINDSGGLNTQLAGWGLEDVDLYEKFIKRNDIEIFRAPDPGLVHVYHPHAPCDPESTIEQQTMCHAAQADLFSNAASAVNFINHRGYLDFLSG